MPRWHLHNEHPSPGSSAHGVKPLSDLPGPLDTYQIPFQEFRGRARSGASWRGESSLTVRCKRVEVGGQ